MKIFRKILKYFILFLGAIVVLLIAVYIFIQTDTFNGLALNFALNKLNDSESWLKKENFITVESINGNILESLQVNNIVITVKKDTLVNIKKLDIKYDIWALLKQKISLDYVVINSPVVNLTKIKEGSDSLFWNFTNLFTPSVDTTPSQFDWDIYVNSLIIENGELKILGDIPTKPLWAVQWERQNEFELNELDISGFRLDMTGEYSKEFKKINVRNISFNSNTDIALRKLSFDAYINTHDALTEISNLELLTDRSHIKLDRFSANALNPLDSNAFYDYGDKNVSLVLNVEKFNFADLKYFLPEIDMLDGTLSLYLDASGVFKDLNINNLILNLPNSNINVKGKVQNLSNLDSLYFDVTTSFKINPADVKAMLKIKSVPDFRNLGIVQADIDYKGRYYDFYSNFDIRSAGGKIQGQGYLNIDEERYSGNVITNNLNLSPILNNKKFKSNINLTASFQGSGFSIGTMSTGIKYTLRNSAAAGYNIASSKGTVNINRNNISLNIKANSTAGNAAVKGKINISNMKNPVYSIKGTVNNMDISYFSKDIKDKSNLNAAFDINGSGINMNNLAGKFNIDIGNSVYSQYEIPETSIIARLNMDADSSILHVTNNAMEFKADGKFGFSALMNALLYNISTVSNIAGEKLYSDTSINYTDLSLYEHTENVNINYEFITKDSSELKKLTAPFGIIFNGELNGSLLNSQDGFNLKSVVIIKNFRNRDTTIILNNFKSNIAFTNDYTKFYDEDPLSSLELNMDANADRLWYSSYKFDSLKAGLILSEDIGNLFISGKMDTVKYLRLKSDIDLRGNSIILNVDSLQAKYDIYEVANNNRWTINYIPQQEIKITQLGLISGNMVLNVDGNYSLTGESNINIKGENLNLGEIYGMLRPFDTTATGEMSVYPVQGEFRSVFVNLQGTPEDFGINLDVKTNLLKYDTIGVGNIVANVKYKNNILSPDIDITNTGNKGNLKIVGNIPIGNIFIIKDTLAAIGDKPSELLLTADNFQIQYFSKLFPGIGDLQGILNGTLNATGTYLSPDLKGELTMAKGKYFWDFTGMYYNYNFKISTENSKLIIEYVRLYNPDDDTRHIDLFGNIDFKGYNLNDINLTTSGDMVLLDKSNEENRLGLKGYLLGGIGNPPVTIKGNMQKLNINGQFLIKKATIMSLPNSRQGYQIDHENMVYISANDSVLASDTNRRRISLTEYESVNPFMRNRYILIDTTKSLSVMEILALDLEIKTEKNIYVSIDFNNLTRDRLFGEIMADLRIKSDGGELNVTGVADVTGNSYYRYYRDFKIKESKITFRGPIDKPELDIRAVYENTKSTEQFGTITTNPIQVVLTVKGEPSDPVISLKLYENGTEMQGNDATADAITFLLFGKYKNELSATERQSVASGIGSTIGSLYVSSYFGQIVRGIMPFIKDAELKYTEGGLQNTSVNVSSDVYGTNVTVGSRIMHNNTYLEFNVEYPLNDILQLDLSEKLLLQFSRKQLSSNVFSNMNVYYTTGLKAVYKFKF